MNFEQKLKETAEHAILKMIADSSNWVVSRYENRLQIPPDFVQGIWQMVDRDRLKKLIAERVESELADRLVNHMAAEISTDIKQILSVNERREAIRSIARDHMDSIMSAGLKHGGESDTSDRFDESDTKRAAAIKGLGLDQKVR